MGAAMIPLTYRITLEIGGRPNCHAEPVPWVRPRVRTGQLDRVRAVKQMDDAFEALLREELAAMVRELREEQVRRKRSVRKT